MRTILVTGGAGFIGSHLVERLLAEGAAVRVVDDLSSGRLENLGAVRRDPRLVVRVASVEDRDELRSLAGGVDWIVHLAAVVGVRPAVERPATTQTSLLRGIESVLDAARDTGASVFLASSSEVYGGAARVPFREEEELRLGPAERVRFGYGAAKAMGEFLAQAYAREHGVRGIAGRFFNTVGPRQTGRFGMVVPRFVEQALAGEPLTVYGDGRQRRCFTDVRDTAEAIVRLLDAPDAVGRVVNVGSDRELSIRELADRVIERSGRRSEIRFLSYEEVYPSGFAEVRRRIPCLERLERLTGFRPSRPFDETLDSVIRSIRERRPALRAPEAKRARATGDAGAR